MNKSTDISLVIPVYNEEEVLAALFDRLYPALDALGRSYEVIFVDDGSRDRSVAILREQFERRPEVTRVVLFTSNFGQHRAILAGFAHARGRYVITLDADLQNPPEEIARVVAELDAGHDYVGTIRQRRQDVIWPFVPALAYTFASRPTEINVRHEDRSAGESKYSVYRLIKLNFDLMTGFSIVPMQLFSALGFMVSMLSILFGVGLVIRRLVGGAEAAEQGIFTLFAIAFLLIGVTLFGLGLLGEYVGRIYEEVRRRPRYIVGAVLERPQEPL
jgi:undecaprenyl-phosphate 4-deoxy-4-formamido-L-arabinose transferase